MKQLKQMVDADGLSVNAYLPSDTVYNEVLTASTALGVSVPTGAHYVIIGTDSDLWVNLAGTAAIPTASTTAGSVRVPANTQRVFYIESTVTSISLISASAAKVTLEFYSR